MSSGTASWTFQNVTSNDWNGNSVFVVCCVYSNEWKRKERKQWMIKLPNPLRLCSNVNNNNWSKFYQIASTHALIFIFISIECESFDSSKGSKAKKSHLERGQREGRETCCSRENRLLRIQSHSHACSLVNGKHVYCSSI